MQKTQSLGHLKILKIKLSIFFTIIVFTCLILINLLVFYWKYQKTYKAEVEVLDKLSKVFIEQREVLKLWHIWELRKFGLINFLVKNTDSWKILLKRDTIWIWEEISELMEKPWAKRLEIDWINYVVLAKQFPRKSIMIYCFKESYYSKEKLVSDFLRSSFYLFLFSIIIYLLVFRLVSFSLRSVERSIKDMEEFVHNAWHELKTPLAVISSNLQLAEKTWDYKDLNKESLKELKKANSLIDSLLSLASISTEVEMEELNLKDEIERICKENEKKLKEKDIKLNLNLNDFKIKTSKEHFYILFSNIFFNAIRYSDKPWEITIDLKNWILDVTDRWIWISEENLEKIFNRFFQEGESRESSEGFWVWLSLVKKVSEIYNWKVVVKSIKWNWTKFTVKF